MSEPWLDEFLDELDRREVEWRDEEDLVVAHLLEFFKGDIEKVMLWLRTPNPLLGQIDPNFLLLLRPGRCLKFVETTLAENEPPEMLS